MQRNDRPVKRKLSMSSRNISEEFIEGEVITCVKYYMCRSCSKRAAHRSFDLRMWRSLMTFQRIVLLQ